MVQGFGLELVKTFYVSIPWSLDGRFSSRGWALGHRSTDRAVTVVRHAGHLHADTTRLHPAAAVHCPAAATGTPSSAATPKAPTTRFRTHYFTCRGVAGSTRTGGTTGPTSDTRIEAVRADANAPALCVRVQAAPVTFGEGRRNANPRWSQE